MGRQTKREIIRNDKEGKNPNLPVKNKCRGQGYAAIDPFFQNWKGGFFLFIYYSEIGKK